MDYLRETSEGTCLTVRVTPRAGRNAWAGWHAGMPKIRLCAPPAEGQANRALMEFLAEALDRPRSTLELIAGASSRTKTVRLRGCPADHIRSRIPPA
ncbi:MAG: DUF167 domain-containing protein [Kiritimatiellae bacterium]|nr:DUF167 domain-containing protein [Kiritimatiellia bacterium]